MPYKLSPSSINLVLECPRCFWLTHHKVWKRPIGITSSLPSGMDKILKEYFDKHMKEGKLPPELYKEHQCENLKLCEDEQLLKVWRNNFKGVSFIDNEGNELHGAVDNILLNGDKMIVLDYKTRGFPLKEDTTKCYQLQLDIYNFLLRKNGYMTEDYAFLLFYIPKKVIEAGEILFERILVKMKISVENAEKTWKNALKLLESDCPKKTCEWCLKV